MTEHTVPNLDALGARLSGMRDALRLYDAFAEVSRELRVAFDLAGLVYISNAPRPRSETWRAEWNDIAARVAFYLAALDADASPRSHAARVARARLRRWDHHTSCVDLAWEAAVAPRGAT
jgi:hypothetical protein